MAKREYPSDKQDQYMIRFPEGMRDVLKHAAAENKRSLNAEIVRRLDWSIEEEAEQERSRVYARWLEHGAEGKAPLEPLHLRERIPMPKDEQDYSYGLPVHDEMATQLSEISAKLQELIDQNALLTRELSAMYRQEAERRNREDGY